jgi:hypothetical protein
MGAEALRPQHPQRLSEIPQRLSEIPQREYLNTKKSFPQGCGKLKQIFN